MPIDRHGMLLTAIRAVLPRRTGAPVLAGLRHFADSQGCGLIAEGIETEAELATLVALDVRSGQGYLLGRPVPLPAPRA